MQNMPCNLQWCELFLLHCFPPQLSFHRFCRSTVLNWYYVTILLRICFKKCTNCRFCGIICKSCKIVSKIDVDVAQSKAAPICACCCGSKKGRGAGPLPYSAYFCGSSTLSVNHSFSQCRVRVPPWASAAARTLFRS